MTKKTKKQCQVLLEHLEQGGTFANCEAYKFHIGSPTKIISLLRRKWGQPIKDKWESGTNEYGDWRAKRYWLDRGAV